MRKTYKNNLGEIITVKIFKHKCEEFIGLTLSQFRSTTLKNFVLKVNSK